MQKDDMVRVDNWPRTNGRRFRVIRVREDEVDGIEPGQAALRTFPRANCHVDRAMTRAERERAEWRTR